MTKEKFMLLAIEEALRGINSGAGGPFGAVIVKEDRVLAVSHNTVLKDGLPTRHAEVNAIEKAARALKSHDLSGCEIYSTTQPCPMCFSAIHWARLDRLVWGTTIDDVSELGFNEMTVTPIQLKNSSGSEVEIEGPFLQAECRELLEKWSRLPEDLRGIY